MPYAKTLVPSTQPIPMLVATTKEPSLLGQLALHDFADPAVTDGFTQARDSLISIDHTHLTLNVAGEHLLDDHDGDPRAPDGWWPAVDALQGHCYVWITTQHIDLSSPESGQIMLQLLDQPNTSRAAMVPITHDPVCRVSAPPCC